jgi:hypothetical protein
MQLFGRFADAGLRCRQPHMLEEIVHPWREPCRSGKLGVVTFKPHGCSGFDPDRLSVIFGTEGGGTGYR